MRIIVLLLGGIMLSSIANAQMKTTPVVEVQGIDCIIGIITDNPNDFYKIVDLLEYTDGISVRDYCFQDKLLSISFNPKFFKEETEVFDLINSYFVDAKCYRKTMSREVYERQCNNEVVKQKTK